MPLWTERGGFARRTARGRASSVEKDPVNGMIMIEYLAMMLRGLVKKISPAKSLPLPSVAY